MGFESEPFFLGLSLGMSHHGVIKIKLLEIMDIVTLKVFYKEL